MPYSKYKKYARKHFNMSTAQKALTIALGVKKLLNVELKHIDIATTEITPSDSGGVHSLVNCAEGVTSSTRNGLSIRAKSLNMHFAYVQNASASETIIKIYIVLDKSPNGTKASYLDIMEEATIVSQTNNVGWSRFTILATKTVKMSVDGGSNGYFSIYKKLNLPVKYETSNGGDDDVQSNQILMLAVSDQTTNTPTLGFTSRVRYLDN